jgi:hypothetical protein
LNVLTDEWELGVKPTQKKRRKKNKLLYEVMEVTYFINAGCGMGKKLCVLFFFEGGAADV